MPFPTSSYPLTVPSMAWLPGGHNASGALMLDPHMGLDAAYNAAAAAAYFMGINCSLLRPSATDFLAMVETATILTLAIKRAFAYQLLE